MAQPRGSPAGETSRSRQGRSAAPGRAAGPKCVLCLAPRGLRGNPVSPALRAYHVAIAENWAEVLRLARRSAHDLYVIVGPLDWTSAREACRRIRRFDPHTPIVVYATHGTPAERREVMAAGAQAYIAHYDELRNLAGLAAQLIMLAELRSMEALRA